MNFFLKKRLMSQHLNCSLCEPAPVAIEFGTYHQMVSIVLGFWTLTKAQLPKLRKFIYIYNHVKKASVMISNALSEQRFRQK